MTDRLFSSLVRPPLHDLHPPHRINVRHLPSIPFSKVSALHGASIATNRFHANNLLLQSLGTPGQNIHQPSKKNVNRPTKNIFDPIQSKPRPITIIKQGNDKPRKTITILLNRRTMQTLDQLLADISEAFGYQKHRADKVGEICRDAEVMKDCMCLDQAAIHSERTTSEWHP